MKLFTADKKQSGRWVIKQRGNPLLLVQQTTNNKKKRKTYIIPNNQIIETRNISSQKGFQSNKEVIHSHWYNKQPTTRRNKRRYIIANNQINETKNNISSQKLFQSKQWGNPLPLVQQITNKKKKQENFTSTLSQRIKVVKLIQILHSNRDTYKQKTFFIYILYKVS